MIFRTNSPYSHSPPEAKVGNWTVQWASCGSCTARHTKSVSYVTVVGGGLYDILMTTKKAFCFLDVSGYFCCILRISAVLRLTIFQSRYCRLHHLLGSSPQPSESGRPQTPVGQGPTRFHQFQLTNLGRCYLWISLMMITWKFCHSATCIVNIQITTQ